MAKVRKVLVPVGTHQGEGEPVAVTPERVDHWVKTYDEIRATGRTFPVPWGHQKAAAEPLDPNDPDHKAYLDSRFNAGWVDAYEKGPEGELVGVLDLPALELNPEGRLIDPKTGSAVKDVSVGVRKLFRDGQGREWHDVPVHVALTPNPAWADPAGFARLHHQHAAPTPEAETAYLSLATLAVPVATPGQSQAPAPGQPEELLQPPAPDKAVTLAGEVLAKLRAMGVTLPESLNTADPGTVFEHLLTALTVLEGRLSQQATAAAQAATAAKTSPAQGAQAQQPQAAYLSLPEYTENRVVKRFVDDRERERKAELRARIDGLAEGGLAPPLVEELRAATAHSYLSLDTLDFERPAPHLYAPVLVDFLERTFKALPLSGRSYLANESEVRPVPNPLEREGSADQQAMEELLDIAYPRRHLAAQTAKG